jgi:hypothetical protein
MTFRRFAAVVLPVLMLCPVSISASKRHPAVYVDRGACPFECCVYRDWQARRPVTIRSSPRLNAKRIATLKTGANVQALTGFVRTQAGRFRVKRNFGRFVAGETVWVYTYHGEGYFTVWYRGRLIKESLNFSPYGGSMGKRCEETKYCFGELDSELRSDWWVKIRLADGRLGWTNQAGDFSNTDACG